MRFRTTEILLGAMAFAAPAAGLRGFKVDHHLELGRLKDRQVGWLLPLEKAAGVATNQPRRFDLAGSVAHETAFS
jgi:hypothetical protein